MKKYMIGFVIILSVLVGQDKYQFFLKSDDNLKLVGEENYKIIKTELDKMLADYNSKIDLDNYWKVKYGEKVFVRQERDLDAINAALEMDRALMAGMNIYEKKAHMDLIESYGTKNIYKDVQGERNRIIESGETLFTKEAEWSDIVSYLGGYSELSKSGLTKEDASLFDIEVKLDKIELTGPSTCLAHVKIYGDEDYAFKFHKIPKSVYKYKGTYTFDYDENHLVLYAGNNLDAKFNFEKKEYLPIDQHHLRIDNNLLPSIQSYRSTIITMIDDIIPESVWIKASPKYKTYRNYYINDGILNEAIFEYDINNMTLKELEDKIARRKYSAYERVLRKTEEERIEKELKKFKNSGYKSILYQCVFWSLVMIYTSVSET